MEQSSQSQFLSKHSKKIGLEIELTYNLSTKEWKELYRKHCTDTVCPIPDYEMFKKLIIARLEGHRLLYKRVHSDGGGIELSLRAFTEPLYKYYKNEIKDILLTCKEFLLYPSEKDGIHINIDIFTAKELKHFLDIIGPESDFKDFMADFIGRPKSADKLGNIDALMGDFNGTKPEVTKSLWGRYVAEMLENIDKEFCMLNLCFNKNGRPIIEWRWFGSTTNINRLYALVEFTYSILSYEGLSLKGWVKQVCRERFTRPHIFKEIRKYQQTRKYMGIHRYL